MKKPEEIKIALRICVQHDRNKCDECPYDKKCGRKDVGLLQDAIAYIQQLEETITLMKVQMHGDCGVCKHRTGFDIEGAIMSRLCYECLRKETRPNWEYEGLPELARKENK